MYARIGLIRLRISDGTRVKSKCNKHVVLTLTVYRPSVSPNLHRVLKTEPGKACDSAFEPSHFSLLKRLLVGKGGDLIRHKLPFNLPLLGASKGFFFSFVFFFFFVWAPT